jgi:chemotaxis response regulator CheB
MVAASKQVRVMVVSAVPYTRYVISGELNSEADVFVVGTAQTADEIAEKRALLRPDVVVVDVDCRRDLSKIRRIIQECDLPVLALCSRTSSGVEMADAALEAGAADVVGRSHSDAGRMVFDPHLPPRIRAVAQGAADAIG